MNKNQYFRDRIKKFYDNNQRDFFWRREKLSPFQVLITELFLKKTRAETVDQRIEPFVKRYNTAGKLCKEQRGRILRKISPLGLGNQRTTALKKIAGFVHENFEGRIPNRLPEIEGIPHVGLYIANATFCFGFNKRVPILDVNSSRIISRFFDIDARKDLRDNKALQLKAGELLPRKSFKEYNWGLLDLGALVCKTRPLCGKCPLRKGCGYCSRYHHGKEAL
ncbi:MAG: hypothetical protein HZA28_06285 [Candidatus Omnitrophica bacterium]|nr:hypothetical protein [Candidatus Omnitrophota bacterium]